MYKDIDIFLNTLKIGDYLVAKDGDGNDFVLDKIIDRHTIFPIAIKTSKGWSYTDEEGDSVELSVGDEELGCNYILESNPRTTSEEEIAFILLQCENNNEPE